MAHNDMTDDQNALIVQEVSKSFAGTHALRGASLYVDAGEILVLLGPSGCGKTTLLRTIAGLEKPDEGRLLWQGRDLTLMPVNERGFGMVFQDYALFPHKNVAQNVIFGLRMQAWEPARMTQRLDEVLTLTGLKGYETRRIEQLSGGEQQRVALARALAPMPALLLLDEPLGALDRALRERLMLELRAILKHAGPTQEGVAAVYVTHDQTEAFAIADRVAIMFAGRIEQVAAPIALYRRPATAEVARFLGMQNLLEGELVAGDSNRVHTRLGRLEFASAQVMPGSKEVVVLLRPDSARLVAADGAAPNKLAGRLTNVSFRGRFQIMTIEVGESRLRFELDQSEELPAPGTAIHVAVDPAGVQLLPRR